MRLLLAILLLVPGLFAQGTTPATGSFTKVTLGSGYRTFVIAQFDKAGPWVASRGCYPLWGQYLSATFSEENDEFGCWSYAENRWIGLLQSSSTHSVHRPQTGHQWGYQAYDPIKDLLYWVSNSGAQGLEEMWSLYQLDFAGLTSSDIPLMTTSGALTREWINGAGTLSGYHVLDYTNGVMIFFPDHNLATGKAAVCTLSTMACVTSATTNGPPATQATSSFLFDPDDSRSYFLPGGSAFIFSIDGANPAAGWKKFDSAICTGADCVFTSGSIGHPPIRNAQGMAHTTVDHLILMIGGWDGSGNTIPDVWTFDPAANSGAGAWVEVCGPGATSCGTVGTSYPNFAKSLLKDGDRLVFNGGDNVFVIADNSQNIYLYAYTAATGNFGRTTPSYAPAVGVSPITGPLNRTLPPSSPSSSNAQTGAFDLSIDSAAGTYYVAHVEPNLPTIAGTSQFPVPYIWSSTASGNWLPTGTQASAASAIGNGSLNQPSGHPYHATVGGVEWETHDKRNWSGSSSNGKAVIQSYSAGTWSGGDVGCFTATCFSSGSTLPQNSPRRLLNVVGSPYALTIEYLSTFNQLSDVFVANCAAINPCTSLTGSTKLNVLSSSYVTYADMATDGSGNLMVCWTEEIDANTRVTMTTTPQLECKYWNGSAFSVIGGGSLNQSATSWARAPSVVYASGTWYVGYTEQTQTGLPKLYVLSCPLVGSCTVVGGGPLNINGTTGIAYHPSLANDGAALLLGWEEQSAQGQKARGYIKKWDGAAWSSIATAFAADATNGSVLDVSITVATPGTVTAAWTEASWGNLPQIYTGSWAISTPKGLFTGILASGAIVR